MSTLYEITGDMLTLEAILYNNLDDDGNLKEMSEEDRATVREWIGETEAALTAKTDSYGMFIRNIEQEIDELNGLIKTYDDEASRLRRRRTMRENLVARLKLHVQEALVRLGMKKVKTTLFSFTRQNTAPSVKEQVNFDWKEIPADYIKGELNKTAIKEAIKAGDITVGEGLKFGALFVGKDELPNVKYLGGETCVLR